MLSFSFVLDVSLDNRLELKLFMYFSYIWLLFWSKFFTCFLILLFLSYFIMLIFYYSCSISSNKSFFFFSYACAVFCSSSDYCSSSYYFFYFCSKSLLSSWSSKSLLFLEFLFPFLVLLFIILAFSLGKISNY